MVGTKISPLFVKKEREYIPCGRCLKKAIDPKINKKLYRKYYCEECYFEVKKRRNEVENNLTKMGVDPFKLKEYTNLITVYLEKYK